MLPYITKFIAFRLLKKLCIVINWW